MIHHVARERVLQRLVRECQVRMMPEAFVNAVLATVEHLGVSTERLAAVSDNDQLVELVRLLNRHVPEALEPGAAGEVGDRMLAGPGPRRQGCRFYGECLKTFARQHGCKANGEGHCPASCSRFEPSFDGGR